MMTFTAAEIAAATNGRLDGAAPDLVVDGAVEVDSRRCGPGSLFVCLRGEHTDGHEHVPDALARGARLCIAETAVPAPAVRVDDASVGLGQLAAAALRRADDCRVTGVTGSSGKTSTKDLLAVVLGADGPTVAAAGSFNNEVGLPLTVLRIEPQTRHLALEYSARGSGHIRYLCQIAPPTVGIVLNVGSAHLGEFGSRAAIAAAKAELVEALPSTGTAVLSADDPLVAAMADRTDAAVTTFGHSPSAGVRIEDVVFDDVARPRFRLVTAQGDATVSLALSGAHHVDNAAAVVAAALARGIDLGGAVAAIEAVRTLSPHRMALSTRQDGLLVIDDAYNANPESVRAALDTLHRLASSRTGRSWAVLGEMRELGDASQALHRSIGEYAAAIGLDVVVSVGPAARAIRLGAEAGATWRGTAYDVPDVAAAVQLLSANVTPDDAVLVKASNAERLWRVAEALDAASPRSAEAGAAR